MWNKTQLHITFAGISIYQNRLLRIYQLHWEPLPILPRSWRVPYNHIYDFLYFHGLVRIPSFTVLITSNPLLKWESEQPCACASVVVTFKEGLDWHELQNSGMPLDLVEYSNTSLENMDDLSSSSRAGLSNSATRPSLRTRTTSLSITVGIR